MGQKHRWLDHHLSSVEGKTAALDSANPYSVDAHAVIAQICELNVRSSWMAEQNLKIQCQMQSITKSTM